MAGRIQINYKSGQSVEIECEAFSISRIEADLNLAWKGVHPRPLLLGVEHIESVWALDRTSPAQQNGRARIEDKADEADAADSTPA
ncbi:MAG: hypothetical protein WBV80_02695 [Mycobacterium sp.]